MKQYHPIESEGIYVQFFADMSQNSQVNNCAGVSFLMKLEASGLKASVISLFLAKILPMKKQSLSIIIKDCCSKDNSTTDIFLDIFPKFSGKPQFTAPLEAH